MRLTRCLFVLLALAAGTRPAVAAVERIEVVERQTLANGAPFGEAGPYEKLRGRVHLALDPSLAANAPVADLGRAPRDADGKVRFTADFFLMRPTDPRRGNGTLIYDVNNRGGLAMLPQLNEAPATNDPTSAAELGNGFLLRRGFTMLWSAWVWDVAADPKDKRLVLKPPVATEKGRPITGRTSYEIIVDAPSPTANFGGNLGLPYPPAQPDAPDATLTARERPEAPPHPIARQRWRFVPAPDGGPSRQLALEGDFQPGHIYRLTYTARDPVVVAAGLAGIRDLLAHVRHNGLEGAPAPARTLMFGISQSGRVIQTMLLRGLHVDEAGRSIMDGAFVHIAGGGKGGFDYRFAMPTRHMSMLEEHDYATDYFPFSLMDERDPVGGAHGSVLDQARAAGVVPKLFYVNNSTEYWNRAASLIHTDPAGARDAVIDPRARIYLIAGAQHYIGRQRSRGIYANCVNPLNHYREMRALLLSLDRWVRDGTEPPPSAYPRLADGTLVTVEAHKGALPKLARLALPESNLRPPRLDYGRRFESQRIADTIPPKRGKPYETRVPKPNGDGNDVAGIQPPEILAPLGTRLGFNTRTESAGFPWATARWDGSFIPFARTEAERRFANDPRPSLEARYADRADYEKRLRTAAQQTVSAGFLLPEEVDAVVAQGGAFYDRIMGHDPADRTCDYLFGS